MFSKIKRVFKKELTDEELAKKISEFDMDDDDYKAMVIAALKILMPAIIIIALIFYLVIYLLFM
ncbi:MAG: hypothetical protein ACK5KQ_07165 [Anaerorhabdus sp.]